MSRYEIQQRLFEEFGEELVSDFLEDKQNLFGAAYNLAAESANDNDKGKEKIKDLWKDLWEENWTNRLEYRSLYEIVERFVEVRDSYLCQAFRSNPLIKMYVYRLSRIGTFSSLRAEIKSRRNQMVWINDHLKLPNRQEKALILKMLFLYPDRIREDPLLSRILFSFPLYLFRCNEGSERYNKLLNGLQDDIAKLGFNLKDESDRIQSLIDQRMANFIAHDGEDGQGDTFDTLIFDYITFAKTTYNVSKTPTSAQVQRRPNNPGIAING